MTKVTPSVTPSVTINDVQAAARRIEGRIRRTPLLPATLAHMPLPGNPNLNLKLECLQVSGSFKARGAMSKLTILDEAAKARGLITASGGNHGLGVAYAGHSAGVPVTIYLPGNTPPSKAENLRRWGAEVHMHGDVWDDANKEALKVAERDGKTYIHPFADAEVIAGQGTVSLEVLADAPDTDVLLVSIGGGGLIAGAAMAAKALKPEITVIGIEPVGAPTLHNSVAAGELVELASVDTKANTLAPRRSEDINLGLIQDNVDQIVLVTDAQMQEAARWLWREFGLGVELSAAAAIAALQAGVYVPAPGAVCTALICGTGSDGAS
ncbi:MAG: pyridoxal-phosphate dependent enzyme [Rhodospirillaceae bacterium]|jgi:threonine dehydratase|nr:pyridoxal-phosphate dependent enzyme [Rhodospirillaceae bacterium]MBT4690598.1 pyridoxal-phosphate dependent enzyme [Rhodospirillaceae bacterium]MBT5083856.1 pyridoxal-phosphate dependent enzyme [Rhodospirillaceae bacterium]MBT5526293.1 pyridoxal-phosphate dependent enzyme [Rhodospirillaceae bacterium]MBT5879841.1 pyridoxal-phosphate dependent enzyme [Rhodospirillaceae bacterium]